MARYPRPQAAYPGEWIFVLGSKLVSAIPAHERRREIKHTPGYGTLTTGTIYSLTPGLTATSTMPTLPTPTGESDDESSDSDDDEEDSDEEEEDSDEEEEDSDEEEEDSDEEEEEDSDDEEEDSDEEEEDNDEEEVDSDGEEGGDDEDGEGEGDDNESTLDDDHSIGDEPTTTKAPTLSYSPRAPLQLERLEHLRARGTMVEQDTGPDKSAIEAGVVGTLLLILILLGLCLFRRKISINKHNCTSMRVEPKPSMSEKISSLFGSKSNEIPGERFCDPVLPPPATAGLSSTSTPKNSQNSPYMSQPPIRESSGAAVGPSLDRCNSIHGFSHRPLSRDMSNSSPVAVPTPLTSSTSSSPTLTDGFFYALSELKHPIQAPQPIAVIPAFLVPESPMESQKSHFSWSTNGTSQAPSTPSILTAQRISVAESEQRCSWMSRNRGAMDIPSVTITTMVYQSSLSGSPPTPAGFRQYPGGAVSLGAGEARIKSAEFGNKPRGASRASTAVELECEECVSAI